MDVKALQRELADFAAARDWDRFHAPKNLAAALAVEAAELLELFQWMSEDASTRITPQDSVHGRAAHELADVQIYLLRLADKLDVDLEAAVEEKMSINERKYPADRARGRSTKYSDL